MAKALVHTLAVIFLTVITQVGGVAWLIGLLFKRRVLAFLCAYTILSVSAYWMAPMFGRVPIPCSSDGAYHMQSKIYCVLNRQYVVPELKAAVADLAEEMDQTYPGAKTLILDGNFPYFTGFPLLPHLSHDDGRKVDLAYYYRDENGYSVGKTRSPLGYFAFEMGPTDCQKSRLTLRWDLAWLQGIWPDLRLERQRTSTALKILQRDDRITKVFIEPHLKASLGVHGTKLRFQGCRAARHDDHIHIQL